MLKPGALILTAHKFVGVAGHIYHYAVQQLLLVSTHL